MENIKALKDARLFIEKMISRLESDIDQGKIESGLERAKAEIHSTFEKAEKTFYEANTIADYAVDGVLIQVAKMKYSPLILLAYTLGWSVLGYSISLL